MKQSGVAVIMVLLVLSIVAVTTAVLVKRHQFSQAMASQLMHLGQAKAHIQGAELWASQLLMDDKQSNNVDHLGESWAQLALPMPVEQGFISGSMGDLQSGFNLNSVVQGQQPDIAAIEVLQRLLEQQGLDEQLAWNLVDWIDSNVETHQQGTLEDAYYLSLSLPYRSANQPLADVSELGLVRGFDRHSVAQVSAFVSALPLPTRVNVNSASKTLLMALSSSISEQKAEQLLANRTSTHWGSSSAFTEAVLGPMSQDNQNQWQALKQLVAVNSSYFSLKVAAQFGVAKTRLESKLHRNDNGSVTTLSRIYTP